MRRLFEYVDPNGNSFWSFYRHSAMTLPATRLEMRDRAGVPVTTFMAKLREMAGEPKVAAYDYGRKIGASIPSARWGDEYSTDDYPYGQYRTTARWYVEKNSRGMRVCRVTVNPKTGRPNKPKCTTYSPVWKIGQGSDGYTYLLGGFDGQISMYGGDMKYQKGVWFPGHAGYDTAARILGFS